MTLDARIAQRNSAWHDMIGKHVRLQQLVRDDGGEKPDDEFIVESVDETVVHLKKVSNLANPPRSRSSSSI